MLLLKIYYTDYTHVQRYMDELIWSPRSLRDLEIIYEYIKQDSIEKTHKTRRQMTS